ncbi:hypothetical protein ACE6H2_006348 [Prunus campanulata]
MVPLSKLKSLRLVCLLSPSTFPSRTEILIAGDLKPSHFSVQNRILCRQFTSEISEDQHSFTVNYLITSCGLSPEDAISTSKWIKLQSPENADAVLGLLRNHGFSTTQISKFCKTRPQLLLARPEQTLLPKLEFFSSLGVSREDLAKTLVLNPNLLQRSLEKQLVPTYNFLRSLLPEKNIVSVFKYNSSIFLQAHTKKVVPNIAILRELGMPKSCISLLLGHCTHALIHDTEKFRQVVKEVKEMGFNLEKSTSVLAISIMCRSYYKRILKRNCEVYSRWGWSEADVLSAFRRRPECIALSEKKIMQTMDLLVNKMGWSSEIILKSPYVLNYSLQKRTIPRCSVVRVLLSKGLINTEKLSLYSVFGPVEKEFLERFVDSYLGEVPQLLCVYQGKVDIQDV